jgi:hypothetical protein
VRLSEVTDGVSNTIVVAEQSDFAIDSKGRKRNIDAGFPSGWLTGTAGLDVPPNFAPRPPSKVAPNVWNLTTIKYAINTRVFELPGVRDTARGPNNPLLSAHAGGVFAVYLDGSVSFEKESMELLVLRRLVSRGDGAVVTK